MSLNEQEGGWGGMSDNPARQSMERPWSRDDLPVMLGHSYPSTAEGFSETQIKHLCKAQAFWSGWSCMALLICITSL